MQLSLRRLFQLLLILVPLTWTAQTDELFEFNKMILTYGFTIVITMMWAWRMIAERRLIFRFTPFGWFLLAFLVSQVLSTIFSIHPHTSIFGYYSRFHGGLLSSLAYITLFGVAVSNLDRTDLKPLFQSLLLGSLIAVLYALPEHFGLSPSCVMIRGDFSTECWSEATNPRYRIFGTFGQPNWLAAYLLMTIPITLAWVTDTIKNWTRSPRPQASWTAWLPLIWPAATFGLSILALLYTRSRSGFLGLLLILATWLVGLLWLWVRSAQWRPSWNAAKKTNLSAKITTWTKHWTALPGWLVLITIVIFLLTGTSYSPSLGEMLSRIGQSHSTQVDPTPAPPVNPLPSSGTVLENGGTDSGQIRAIVWAGALKIWRHYPWFGSGVETFAYSYYQDRPVAHNLVSEWDFLYNKAHNEFLNLLATTGLVGLLTYLGLMMSFIGFVVWQFNKQSHPPETQLYLLALLTGYLGLAVSNLAGFSTVMVGILFFLWPALAWLLVQPESLNRDHSQTALTPSAKKSKKTGSKRAQSTATTPLFSSEGQWISAATVGLVGSFFLLNVVGWWNNDRLLAQAKQNLNLGNGLEAYQQLATLTQRAPNQAEYWEQYALVLGQLAASAHTSYSATTAATLADEAVNSIDQATQANPVHLNIWKSRARVFLWLTTLSETYYQPAIEALQTAHELAPTDPKILYNLALMYEAVSQPELAESAYQQAIELRPNYEQARKSYAEFLTHQAQHAAALAQYHYIEEVLKPGENLFSEEIAALEASLSGEIAP